MKYKNVSLNNQYIMYSGMDIICPYCEQKCNYDIREGYHDRYSYNEKTIRYQCGNYEHDFFLIYYGFEKYQVIDLTFENNIWFYYYYSNSSHFELNDGLLLKFNDQEYCPNLLDLKDLFKYLEILEFYK